MRKSDEIHVKHALNEWADLGANAIQWLKNIRDGISTPQEALDDMQSNYDRVLILSRAADRAIDGAAANNTIIEALIMEGM